MSVKSTVQAVPRGIVGTWLRAGRVPVTLLGRVAGQKNNEQWAPTLAYEGFEAHVEALVGSLLRDDDLAARGRLRQAKVGQLRKAAEIETVAEQQRQQADERFQDRREQAASRRQQAKRTADQRKRQVEQQAAAKERTVRQKAAKQASAARELKAVQDEVLDRQERSARLAALDREAAALDASKQALDAEETIDVVEETLEATKEARKSG